MAPPPRLFMFERQLTNLQKCRSTFESPLTFKPAPKLANASKKVRALMVRVPPFAFVVITTIPLRPSLPLSDDSQSITH